jgi:hypothetical protein
VSTSFWRRRPPRSLLSRSNCFYLTPASKGHPKHFKAGGPASTSFRHRRSPRPLLGRTGYAYLIPASVVTQTTSAPVGLCLSHSSFEGSPRPILSRSNCLYHTPASKGHPKHFQAGGAASTSFRLRRVTQTNYEPVELFLSHSGFEGSSRPLLGRSGCIVLIPASNVTQTTFCPVGLTIYNFGVKGHPDHFWAVRAKSKKQKKFRRPLGFELIPLWASSALSYWLFRPMTSRR